MRTCFTLCVVFAAMSIVSAAQTEEKATGRPPKKGDTITVKGCLSGGALAATESSDLEANGLLAVGLTFRVTGNKALLKKLRDQHERSIVEVTGVLKSDVPQQAGQSRTVGRMRITIGGASPNPNASDAEARRSLPVLEVKSFDGLRTSC